MIQNLLSYVPAQLVAPSSGAETVATETVCGSSQACTVALAVWLLLMKHLYLVLSFIAVVVLILAYLYSQRRTCR